MSPKPLQKKYFGNEDPVGKTLILGQESPVKITGMIDKVPDNSHFHYPAFISMASFPYTMTGHTWSNLGFYTYLVLNKNTNPARLAAKFPQLVAEHVVPEVQHDMGVSLAEARKSVNTFRFSLQPLTRIHLYSHTKYEIEPNGDIQYVYIFSALMVFILLLACVNFINLSTAGAAGRAREIGIRKVLGSEKKMLIGQFLSESMLVGLFSMLLACVLVFLLLPYFNQLSGKHINAGAFLNYRTVSLITLLTLLTGLCAGLYPAFFLSSFKPVKVLKANAASSAGRRSSLRSGLVVFQFAISVCLIIATIIIYRQLHFMQNKKLGYDKNQVLIIENTYTLGNNENAFRQELMQDSRVVNTTISADVPGRGGGDGTQAYPEDKESNESNAEIHINIFHVDYNYLSTLGIQMAEGRNLSPDFPSDSFAVVINQAAVRAFSWNRVNPLNKFIVCSGQRKYKVIGVVKDFNYASLLHEVAPMVMMLGRNRGAIMVKIKTADISGLLADLKKQWGAFRPYAPFSYSFLDAKFAALYVSEEKTGQIFMVFAIAAIIIACLGLFGLVTFMANQRTKEIGIRKIVGASAPGLVLLLSKDFLKLVILAIIIASPLAWWGMHKWLENFAYRINIAWWIFLLAGMLAVLIALATVSVKAVRAAMANPVESLRTE